MAGYLKDITPDPLQRFVLWRRVRIRMSSQAVRTLPDFLVIGAQRSGTSSLYKYLGRHPEIAPALRKEVGYFTRFYGNGVGWYRAHFPLQLRRELVRRFSGRELLTFEATPDYLLHPLAAARAAELLPDAMLIVLLRDPVFRAFSHYQHMVRLGFEQLGFEAALEREPKRLARDLERMTADPAYDPKLFLRFSYVTRGLYAEQLERWMERYPRDRFLILASEDFYGDSARSYLEVVRFLGLRPWSPTTFPNHSEPGQAPAAGRLEPHVRELLVETFREPNRALFDLIGRELEWSR